MGFLVIVAFAGVVPVAEVDAIVAVQNGEGAEPGVGAGKKILAVVGDVARAFALQDVHVDAVAVDVAHEDLAAVFVGPVVALVDHAAGVGVAAAGLRVGALPAARRGPVSSRPV